MTPESYHFGTRLAKRLDYYAFPRTGSHYLWACLTGLLDLVFFPNELVDLPEAKSRAEELNPQAFYALRLREDGVPVHPVYIDAAPNGLHGRPTVGEWPVIILIRDPHAAIYSWYHTAVSRWGADIADRRTWMADAYEQYRRFYDDAWALLDSAGNKAHLVRFEQLKATAATLRELVAFVGVQPKLSPEFVHWCTRFEQMTAAKPRSFYRGGSDAVWRQDEGWLADWRSISPGDFSKYGYAVNT